SFNAIGMPCRGPRQLPRICSASISRADFRACSLVTVMNALSVELWRSIRLRQAFVRSTGDAAFLRSRSEAPRRVKSVRSCDSAKAGFNAELTTAEVAAARKLLRL